MKVFTKFVLLGLLGVFTLQGCSRFNPSVTFNLDYNANFTVESSRILNLPFDFVTPNITTNSEAEFEANDTRKDLVEEITLENLTLNVTSPNGKTFSFLKAIYLYIDAEGLEETRFAFKEDIDKDDVQITLDKDPANLADYVKKETFTIRAETITRETLNQDVEIASEMQFKVRAKLLK